MLTNKDIIRMHLDSFIHDYPDQTWASLLGYCLGYYGNIDMDMLSVVLELQLEGKVK